MALFERHLDLGPPLVASGWRNVAIGTWRAAKDPSVYGVLELPAAAALAYAARTAAASGERVTVTHVVGKAVAETFRRHPEINAVLRFGRIYPRRHVTLFFQVAADTAGDDLSGAVVRAAEGKSLAALAAEVNAAVTRVRDRSDPSYRRMKALMAVLPGCLAGLVLDLAGFLQYGLNLWTPLLGTPKDPLGGVMITNVGSLGLDFAFAPLVPYARVPMVITACAVRDRPVVVDGNVRAAPVLRLCVTFDHRIIDGVHAARLANTMEAIFADPEGELGAP